MRYTAAFAFIAFLSAAPARAQTLDVPQPSPHARVEQRVGITDISVDYSSPAVKGRKVWGELVAWDKPWRSGANAVTKLTATQEFLFGDKKVPAGEYGLYTIPGKSSWTVALNSRATGSGAQPYDPAADVARLSVKPEKVGHRERLAYIFSDTTDEGTRLDLEWESVRIAIPLKIDTHRQVLSNIDKTLGETWRPHFVAARWLLDSGGNLGQALSYIDTSVGIKPTWWNNWVRAQILGKSGRESDAVAAAQKAQELGHGDDVYNYFKDDISKSINDWKKKQS